MRRDAWRGGREVLLEASHVIHRIDVIAGADQTSVDTEALRKSKRTLDYRARRAFEKEWGRGKLLWEAVAVEGGSGLAGLKTVCLKCRATGSS